MGKPKELEHYWICESCAYLKGGKWSEGHVCTVTHGSCPYCEEEATLIPIVDFNWPKWRTGHLRD